MNKLKYIFQEIRRKFDDWYIVKRGFYDKDFCPLKCHYCGSTDLEDCNQSYLDECYRGTLLEYDCRCEKCGKILNHWAYGYWQR